jgi:hypothetical protein
MFRSLWAGLSRGLSPESVGEPAVFPDACEFFDDACFNEVLGELQTAWRGGPDAAPPEYHDLIDLALRRMRQDLQSGRRAEVIAEVRRELAYRAWCMQEDPLERKLSPSAPLTQTRTGI